MSSEQKEREIILDAIFFQAHTYTFTHILILRTKPWELSGLIRCGAALHCFFWTNGKLFFSDNALRKIDNFARGEKIKAKPEPRDGNEI